MAYTIGGVLFVVLLIFMAASSERTGIDGVRPPATWIFRRQGRARAGALTARQTRA